MKKMYLSNVWKVKLAFLNWYPIQLFVIIFLAVSSLHSNAEPVLISDTDHIDASKSLPASSPVIDSSKIFLNLLASTNNQTSSIPLNSEAKLFADNYIRSHTAYFNNMKIWGKPYFDLYDHILSSYGLPVQLKYLSVIESSLSSNAVSWAGAVGPWQIMDDAARQYGMRIGYYDDRLDYIKSTNVAAQILKNLYANYKDWLLVIAAYNC